MAARNPHLTLPVPRPFRYRLMVLSHGWCDLQPFRWDDEGETLDTALLVKGRPVSLRITSTKDRGPEQKLRVEVLGGRAPDEEGQEEIGERVRWMFRLGEDFAPFYRLCRRLRALRWLEREGLGRFLRAPTLFEDFVKVLLTTNVNWGGTKSMVRSLVEGLGRPVSPWNGPGEAPRSFPDAPSIASLTEKRLREEMRVGYRAPFLLELAEGAASGKLDLDRFADGGRSTEEIASELGALKGFGPYAVHSLLLTFGRYDRLILDSWIRRTVTEVHFRSPRVKDRSIERLYAPWGEWRVLACWFDCAWASWMESAVKGTAPRTIKEG